jgi:hypothetical protein
MGVSLNYISCVHARQRGATSPVRPDRASLLLERAKRASKELSDQLADVSDLDSESHASET